MLVVLEILPQLFFRGIGEPRCEAAQHVGAVELVRRTRVTMTERDVARVARRNREGHADDSRLHRIETRRFGVERDQVGAVDGRNPARKRRLVAHHLVVLFDRRGRRGHDGRRFRSAVVGAKACRVLLRALRNRIAGIRRTFVARAQVAQPALEFEAFVQRPQRSVIGRADSEIFRRDLQRAIGFDREQLPALR